MSNKFLKVFGHKLKALRELECNTQPELAKLLGCSQQQISHFERGRNALPLDQFFKILHHYGANSNFFMKWGKEEERIYENLTNGKTKECEESNKP